MKTKIIKIIDKLDEIIPKVDYYDINSVGSCIVLFKEYCRRMALWVRIFSLRPKMSLYRYNLPLEINSKWKLDDVELSNLLKEKGILYSPLTMEIIRNYINWELHKNEDQIIKHHLPSPYEPFLLFLERGGDLGLSHGLFDILGAGVPKDFLKEFPREEPFVELDSKVLDNIDKKCNEQKEEIGE